MKTIQALCFFLGLLFANYAQALVPETGLWGGLGEGGRGLSIELQDDNMFVTYYGYQPDGVKSAFYTTLGKYNPTTGIMIGYWAAAQNGQCYGCPPREPQLTNLGNVKFEFFTRTTGRVTFPGNIVVNIVRSVLRVGNTWNDRQELYGTWNEVHGALGTYFGDVLWFRNPFDDTTLTNGFSGQRVNTTRLLVGASTSPGSPETILVLIDTSTNYYTAIAFTPAGNAWTGRSWTYLKTSTLSGNGLESIAFKTLGKVYSELSFGSTAPSTSNVSHLESIEAAEASAQVQAKATSDAAMGGDPETVTIDKTVIQFGDLKRHAEEMAAKLRMMQ